jgi:anti-sigma factor RsiW
MNCAQCEILIHALLDGELDAANAREVEDHVADCAACAGKLAGLRALLAATAQAGLKETAPENLRSRIEATLAPPPQRAVKSTAPMRASRRFFLGGFAAGAGLSAAVATSLVFTVIRSDRSRLIAGEVVSAHLRSLQSGRLTDVETSDQHAVRPWFNGKLDVAPPVADLTAQGFTLIGGRLDYLDGKAVAAIVYRRRRHVINLFVERRGRDTSVAVETLQGFNIRHWMQNGLDFWAVSDLNGDELGEFSEKFAAALRPPVASGADKG